MYRDLTYLEAESGLTFSEEKSQCLLIIYGRKTWNDMRDYGEAGDPAGYACSSQYFVKYPGCKERQTFGKQVSFNGVWLFSLVLLIRVSLRLIYLQITAGGRIAGWLGGMRAMTSVKKGQPKYLEQAGK
jgi:hypothetical protein